MDPLLNTHSHGQTELHGQEQRLGTGPGQGSSQSGGEGVSSSSKGSSTSKSNPSALSIEPREVEGEHRHSGESLGSHGGSSGGMQGIYVTDASASTATTTSQSPTRPRTVSPPSHTKNNNNNNNNNNNPSHAAQGSGLAPGPGLAHTTHTSSHGSLLPLRNFFSASAAHLTEHMVHQHTLSILPPSQYIPSQANTLVTHICQVHSNTPSHTPLVPLHPFKFTYSSPAFSSMTTLGSFIRSIEKQRTRCRSLAHLH